MSKSEEFVAGTVTLALSRWSQGDKTGLDEALEILRPILERRCRFLLRGIRSRDAVLQTQSLVNELYVALAGSELREWGDRAEFLAFCARIVHNFLVDVARRQRSEKHGGGVVFVEGDLTELQAPQDDLQLLLAIDEAVGKIELESQRAATVALLKLQGHSEEEIERELEISRSTVQRDWALSKRWFAEAVGQRKG